MNDVATADIDVYKTLLESTKAIPWQIDWATTKFTYIGPQIESLLGWTPSSWVGVEDWVARMHEEDRDRVFNFCVSQSQAGIDHEADYRALTKDGSFVWIRDVVHVVRDAKGEVKSLVGFMFDISERKKAEEKILLLQKELESLSFKDGLTGVANRRMFDSILEREWGNARRNSQPLSLIMFDIDYFKQYNDRYGHFQGDEVLRRVARCLGLAATRPRDLLARLGGEEFVLVLPESDGKVANQMAEQCNALLFREQIPHKNSSVGPVVTMSAGIGTIIPSHEDEPLKFLEAVDACLYQAKNNGRNCIVATGTESLSIPRPAEDAEADCLFRR
jgi:diguanylate cyclase (GGDEF)-like protein/PAS domain S-box-containing protein